MGHQFKVLVQRKGGTGVSFGDAVCAAAGVRVNGDMGRLTEVQMIDGCGRAKPGDPLVREPQLRNNNPGMPPYKAILA